jgi:hypothetical protein
LTNPADHGSYDKGLAAKSFWSLGPIYAENGKDIGAELKRIEAKFDALVYEKTTWLLKDKIETLILAHNIQPMLQRLQNLEAQMNNAIKQGDVFTLRSTVSGRRMTVSDAGRGTSVWPTQNRAAWEHLQAEKCDRPGIGDGYNCN